MRIIWLVITIALTTFGYAQEVSFDGVEIKDGITVISGTAIPFTGQTVGFYPDGKKCIAIEYRNGIESGTNRTWYNDGTIFNETEIDSGKIHGKWIDYYPDGKKQNEVTYEKDYMNGPCTRWYANGQVSEQGNYHHCREEGEWIYFWENGQVKAQGHFHEAVKTGEWQYFDEKGNSIDGN